MEHWLTRCIENQHTRTGRYLNSESNHHPSQKRDKNDLRTIRVRKGA